MSEAPVLIEGKGVSKTYRTRDGDVETLKPLDFQIRAGEFVSVVGPSGCGKSTLMKMVAGLLPWRSVIDNILLQAEIRNMPRAAARERAEQLLDMAGLK
ncbi:MAG: ATP-binding cassette domain-containing protein, partial [Variovorax sp.]